MSQINTVRGPIDSTELGRTYMHEHVFVLTPDVQQNYPDEWGSEDERVADAVTKLRALAAMVGAEVPDQMVDMFVKDIEEGIADTGVRAGLLKCSIDHQGPTPGVE